METRNIYLGNTKLKEFGSAVDGCFVNIQDEKFYKISNFHQMPHFFMTIVSDSDHWMFISSNGSLSAGRRDRNNALFPYYTDDKIHDYAGITGSKSLFLVDTNHKTYLWEPFSGSSVNVYTIERNIYKSIYGNKLIFEEINHDLGICFRYGWYNSEKFGFVRKSELININQDTIKLHVLDGIQNILPSGVDYDFQNAYSNLLDGYKKSELLEESGLGLFMLSSIPVDRAEPSESLFATSVWSYGLENRKILLSNQQVASFAKGLQVDTELDVRANRGAYFVNAELAIEAKGSQEWMLVAEINQDSRDVINVNHFIQSEMNLGDVVAEDIALGTSNLIRIVANADGLQKGNDELSYARHFSNTLFNIMRGGIIKENYTIDTQDFKLFVQQTNTSVTDRFKKVLDQLPEQVDYKQLHQLAEITGDPDFTRICYEYLPLTFSRRHGDPSRPWNQFSIETKNTDSSPKLDFQGNWRDIFQNWEALALSYPGFIEGMICKFVNASTADGYNPYRITREGIDWESPDPDDPWAYIGYWGDHQIIYLEKLLELSDNFHPGQLGFLLNKEIFAYANVPYRIKSYQDIVKNPKDTIDFDFDLNTEIKDLVAKLGADARLVRKSDDQILKVNLTEKILVTLLSKLSNFIPEAGIWLNTQRPEWNDANNALVGNGVSMVTLYYLRRFLNFWMRIFQDSSHKEIQISEEVKQLFDKINHLFIENALLLESGFSNPDRRRFTDALGEAGSTYRNRIYTHSFSGTKQVIQVKELCDFTNLCIGYLDQSIRVNKRSDGLYHTYNLISYTDQGISIRYLHEMLEGQVAVLSSGYLSVQESLAVMDALKNSMLFREDQYSYLLYPDRQLPRFTEKNNIPLNRVLESKLLSQLIAENTSSILSKDKLGNHHFNGAFRNADLLSAALDEWKIDSDFPNFEQQKKQVLDIYEELFDHQSFTGRSGTFYAYEGLGSIYWHMVSKLLLATQECFFKGINSKADPVVLGKIKDHYYEIKAGIGLSKSPKLYGAFPTDAYSHTPGKAGAKQPGMTGQVKEDVISRLGELGLFVSKGHISFSTTLFNQAELVEKKTSFDYYDLAGKKCEIILQKGQLAFTICQVPVIYTLSVRFYLRIILQNDRVIEIDGNAVDEEYSKKIFERSGEVKKIEVSIPNK